MKEVKDINESAYVAFHEGKVSELEKLPEKTDDSAKESSVEEVRLGDAPYVPSGFLLWVDVNMSIKLKTNDYPEGEWITLMCDDEPSPSQSEGKYWFWTWSKSNWNKNKSLLASKGVEVVKDEYCWHAPCAIAIPYDCVVQDPYR